MTTPDVIDAVHFTAPPVNPTAFGLYSITDWTPDELGRFLHGVEVRGNNYPNGQSSGVWGAAWCSGMVKFVTVDATSGNWKYTFDGATTAAALFNITAANLKTAIEALANVAPGEVSVILVSPGHYRIEHTQRGPVSVASDVGTPLAGGGASVKVADETKQGVRQDILDPFAAITVWAADECDLTLPSRTEIVENAQQILRLEEQPMVEREFAERLKLDAADLGAPQTAASLKLAVGYLEGAMALTNTVGYFHVGAQWASQELGIFNKNGTRWVSPLGHIWVIGGGYVEGLDDQIVATSQPFGWRDTPTTRAAIDERHNRYVAVAERSVTIGYEAVIAAVTIT